MEHLRSLMSRCPTWQYFQHFSDTPVTMFSISPPRWQYFRCLFHTEQMGLSPSQCLNLLVEPHLQWNVEPFTCDWRLRNQKNGTSSKSDLWQAVCFRAFPFHLMKIAIFGKKITLNCWRNLLFYTRYNMGWWPDWGIWRFFGWEFMKVYYRVPLLLLGMCWPSTDRAQVEIFSSHWIWFVTDWTAVELNVDCS